MEKKRQSREERHKRRMQALAYMREGYTLNEVSQMTKYNCDYIRRLCKENNIPVNKFPVNTYSNAKDKATTGSKLLTIAVKLLVAGSTADLAKIGRELGVSRQYVHQVKTRVESLKATAQKMLQDETAREFSRMIEEANAITLLQSIGGRLERHYDNGALSQPDFTQLDLRVLDKIVKMEVEQ